MSKIERMYIHKHTYTHPHKDMPVHTHNYIIVFLLFLICKGALERNAFEVLAFPELPLIRELPASELLVPCIFCEREFPNTQGKNDAVLHHLLVEHQLVIGDVAQVCDFRRYIVHVSWNSYNNKKNK